MGKFFAGLFFLQATCANIELLVWILFPFEYEIIFKFYFPPQTHDLTSEDDMLCATPMPLYYIYFTT